METNGESQTHYTFAERRILTAHFHKWLSVGEIIPPEEKTMDETRIGHRRIRKLCTMSKKSSGKITAPNDELCPLALGLMGGKIGSEESDEARIGADLNSPKPSETPTQAGANGSERESEFHNSLVAREGALEAQFCAESSSANGTHQPYTRLSEVLVGHKSAGSLSSQCEVKKSKIETSLTEEVRKSTDFFWGWLGA